MAMHTQPPGGPKQKGTSSPTPATICGHCGNDIGEGATGLLTRLRTPGLPMRSQEGLRSGNWLQLGALEWNSQKGYNSHPTLHGVCK